MKRRVAGLLLGTGENIKETTVRQIGTLGVVSLLLVLLASASTQAAVVTVDVTINAVNLQGRGITVTYKTELGEKSIELDVSRKAEITVNGKEGSLDSLGQGLQAKVTFDKDLAVVTKIEATGVVVKRKPPELVEVAELNPGSYPWLNEDGLTVFWEIDGVIWTAHRADAESYFSEKKQLFTGRHPALTGDGLEMVFLGTGASGGRGEVINVATREDAQQPFTRGRRIAELAGEEEPKNLSLSPDGLSLYFNRGSGGELVVSTRKSKDSSWTKPKPVSVQSRGISGTLGWVCVPGDGLTMYCCAQGAGQLQANTGNLLVLFRASAAQPFGKPSTIEVEGTPPLYGRSPRYVEATKELFFTRALPKGKKATSWSIWVIRNFVPPTDAGGGK